MDKLLNETGYDVVTEEGAMLTEFLFRIHERLGIPENITVSDMNEASWKFVEQVVRVWQTGYPQEFSDWCLAVEYELTVERPVQQAIKAGGYSPLSYPMRFMQLMKAFMPDVKLQDKEFTRELLRRIPFFKTTNYKL